MAELPGGARVAGFGVAVTGDDRQGRGTGRTWTVPAVAEPGTPVPVSYTRSVAYGVDGSVASVTSPALAGLVAGGAAGTGEVLTPTYDPATRAVKTLTAQVGSGASSTVVAHTKTTLTHKADRAAAERSETVYNVRVPIDHDYYAFAGDTPVLVHNADYAFTPYTKSAGDLAKYTRSRATRDAGSHYGSMSDGEILSTIDNATEGGGIDISRGGRILDGHHAGTSSCDGSTTGGSTRGCRFESGFLEGGVRCL